MALKLQLDKPVEACLKYGKGKYYESRFPGQEGQLMYSLTSGECVFLPEDMDEQFAAKHIGAQDPFVICLRKTRSGAKFYEVHKLSDAVEPEPPSKLERDLAASVAHVQRQRETANPSKSSPSPAVAASGGPTNPPVNGIAVVPDRPRGGSLMASALVAAVDALLIAQDYATAKGLTMFSAEDVRAVANTLYIQHSKDPQYARAAGGRQ
jgi:hypothetical protein